VPGRARHQPLGILDEEIRVLIDRSEPIGILGESSDNGTNRKFVGCRLTGI
jgi:hypothetical protein